MLYHDFGLPRWNSILVFLLLCLPRPNGWLKKKALRWKQFQQLHNVTASWNRTLRTSWKFRAGSIAGHWLQWQASSWAALKRIFSSNWSALFLSVKPVFATCKNEQKRCALAELSYTMQTCSNLACSGQVREQCSRILCSCIVKMNGFELWSPPDLTVWDMSDTASVKKKAGFMSYSTCSRG